MTNNKSLNHPSQYSHIVFSIWNCLPFSWCESVLIRDHLACHCLSRLRIQLLGRMLLIWVHLLMMLESVLVYSFLLLHHLLMILLNLLRLLSTLLVIKLALVLVLLLSRIGGGDILNVLRQSLWPQKLLLLMTWLTTLGHHARIVDRN